MSGSPELFWPELGAHSSESASIKSPRKKNQSSFAGILKVSGKSGGSLSPSLSSKLGAGTLESIPHNEVDGVDHKSSQITGKPFPDDYEDQISEALSAEKISQVDSLYKPIVNLEEKKMQQKIKRQLAKQEKRLRREEELRRQIIAPKGYRVQVVHQNNVAVAQEAKIDAPILPPPDASIESDFPSLGSAPNPRRRRQVVEQLDASGTNVDKEETKEGLQTHGFQMGKRESHSRKEVSKKKDPIFINLQQVLAENKIKKQIPHRHDTKRYSNYQKIFGNVLCGNPLDSSQPSRHRGKVREIPKAKKPTSLKAVILNHRQTKKSLRETKELSQEEANNYYEDSNTSFLEVKSEDRNEIISNCHALSQVEFVKHNDANGNLQSLPYGIGMSSDCAFLQDEFQGSVTDFILPENKDSNDNSYETQDICANYNLIDIDNKQEECRAQDNFNAEEMTEVSWNLNDLQYLESPASLKTSKEPVKKNSNPCKETQPKNCYKTPLASEMKDPVTSECKEAQFNQNDVIHSLRFREYCSQLLIPQLDDAVRGFLKQIHALQERAYQRAGSTPIKFRHRMLTGLHEARKSLLYKKVCLLVIAPDLEKCPEPGGLDSRVNELISLAKNRDIPCVFALSRRKLGRILYKNVGVSCVTVLSADGAEAELNPILGILPEAQKAYQKLMVRQTKCQPETKEEIQEDVNKQVVSSFLNVLEKSLQPEHVPAFLQAIEAVADED